MANYLRQLRNDEKRGVYTDVFTLKAGDFPDEATTADAFLVGRLDGSCFASRIFAVVKTPFPAGSTVTIGHVNDKTGLSIAPWFTDFDLSVGGTVEGPLDKMLFAAISHVGFTAPSQDLLDATTGEVQFIIEYTEEPATTGSYTA
jgi:hypothetical protein